MCKMSLKDRWLTTFEPNLSKRDKICLKVGLATVSEQKVQNDLNGILNAFNAVIQSLSWRIMLDEQTQFNP